MGPDTLLTDDGENILIETINESGCVSDSDDENTFSKRLGVKGIPEHDGIVIQCAAFPRCNSCNLQEYYTRAAMLTVEPGMHMHVLLYATCSLDSFHTKGLREGFWSIPDYCRFLNILSLMS